MPTFIFVEYMIDISQVATLMHVDSIIDTRPFQQNIVIGS